MSQLCPISFITIDGTIARINSLWVASALITYSLTQSLIILLFLSADFIIRIYLNKKYSPLFQLSILVQKYLKLKSELIDSGAKKLAAQFAILFLFLLIFAQLLNYTIATTVVFLIFFSCVLLELLFNYCIGCQIYFILKKMKVT